VTHAADGQVPAKASLGRGAEKALATRNALIDLAAEMFAEQGYIETSIRDIARRGSLTSGAIYGHFRNKADLLVAAISRRTADELEAQSLNTEDPQDYVDTLGRLARAYPERRQLRALIVQGAAAAHTDPETREGLREEQMAHLNAWIEAYELHRDEMGIDPGVDLRSAVLHTWAVEVGLGVLEAVGIEPTSPDAWADTQRRFGVSLRLAVPGSRLKKARKRP
jgi:AcrR family transcriptional regulator